MPKIALTDVSHLVKQYRTAVLNELDKLRDDVQNAGITHRTALSVYDARYNLQSLINNLNEAVVDQYAYEQKMPLPEIGSYICYVRNGGYEIHRVKDIRYKIVSSQQRYGVNGTSIRYNPSSIDLEGININGDAHRYRDINVSFTSWMHDLEKKNVLPVEFAIAEYYAQEDIARIKPLIPYMQIPEGKHICINLLRRLAGEAKRQSEKDAKAKPARTPVQQVLHEVL